jgi:predicted small lipoprotein YifL
MRLPIPIVLLSAILLSGCWWEGPIFYPPDATAAQPISPGLYEARSADRGERPDRVRFTRLANGAWGDGGDAKSWTFFVRLAGTSRDLWIVETIPTDGPDAGYGLMERAGDQWALDVLITCRGTQQIVHAAGGVVENDDPPGADGSADRPSGNNPVCRFADRAALERALLAYAAAHPRLGGGTLTRIGD